MSSNEKKKQKKKNMHIFKRMGIHVFGQVEKHSYYR
jgi:hypothetical protein